MGPGALASKLDFRDINSLYQLKKHELDKSSAFIDSIITSEERNMQETLFTNYRRITITTNKIRISKVLLAMRYLYTLASIYQQSAISKINFSKREEYKYLAPIVDISELSSAFANAHNIPENEARFIFDLFIFDITCGLDMFSQPLLPVADGKVIFCPSVIIQMRPSRVVENYLSRFDIDIGQKGREFERNLKMALKERDLGVKVVGKKLEFVAFDQEPVEFDFLAMFENHLVIMEMK
ncbi:hypothetical protein [Ferroacidibacillus organovorans]|uniref:hypothetical protein n=1 Tax=Ferroacidibacillus organovorans TaxID=1765683 RepID=UPI00128FC8F0|nr:hypothetical protein [Ferroacidibacillus organovorans]